LVIAPGSFLETIRRFWWLEIKSDNAEEMRRKIVESVLVRKLEMPDLTFTSRLREVDASG